jgi:hypothetical protein
VAGFCCQGMVGTRFCYMVCQLGMQMALNFGVAPGSAILTFQRISLYSTGVDWICAYYAHIPHNPIEEKCPDKGVTR